jgi:YD repeat-containing protein
MKTISCVFLLITANIYAQLEQVQTQYEYDNLNRLVKVIFNDGIEKNYVYDDLGNRIQLNTTTLSIDSETLKNTITLYPNPTNRSLRIRTPQNYNNEDVKLRLYDMNGKEILIKRYEIKNDEIEIDVGTISSGIYLLNLINGREKWSQLFIKK